MNTSILSIRLFIIAFFGGLLVSCESGSETNVIVPKTTIAPIFPQDFKSQALQDLYSLTYALEQYKIKYREYPISSSSGTGWDGLYSDYGDSREDWIEGISPEFLPVLPRDPRENQIPNQQYLYKSNGAHYKLISHSPENCKEIQKNYPQLIDPRRNCWAYGYWTHKAFRW